MVKAYGDTSNPLINPNHSLSNIQPPSNPHPHKKEMSTNPILNFFLALNWSCKNAYTLTLSDIEKLFDFEAPKPPLLDQMIPMFEKHLMSTHTKTADHQKTQD